MPNSDWKPVNPCVECFHANHCKQNGECPISRVCGKYFKYIGAKEEAVKLLECLIAKYTKLRDQAISGYAREYYNEVIRDFESMLKDIQEGK